MKGFRLPTPAEDEGGSADGRRLLATLASLFVPGSGHFMIGRPLRGTVWLAGFLALALTGTVHLLPGLALMVVAAADAWWIGAPAPADPSPKEGER